MSYPMPDPNPHPSGPHGPCTWPPAANPTAIAHEITATRRTIPPYPLPPLPAHLVDPPPMTDKALIGTEHDYRAVVVPTPVRPSLIGEVLARATRPGQVRILADLDYGDPRRAS